MAEARVERRLAAILSADVVSYSRLMGEAPHQATVMKLALRTMYSGRHQPDMPGSY